MVRGSKDYAAEPERAAGHVRGGHLHRRCAFGSRPGLRETPGTQGCSIFRVSLHPRPHAPAKPSLRHEDLYEDLRAPRTPSFDEADVSDKPGWVRNLSLDSAEEKRIDELYSKRLKTMAAVGEMIGGLLRTLEQTGKLDNTYVVLTSDNGYHMGQHRLGLGKQSAYEEDIRVPLMIRGPGVPAGISRDEMV